VILVAAAVLSVVVAILRGGHLSRLADVKFRHAWLVLAAVALQFPLVYEMVRGRAVAGVAISALMMLASGVALLYALWANRRLPGIALVGVGMLANVTVMVANGGWMPITMEALSRLGALEKVVAAGATARVWGAKNIVLARGETHLWWLSDVFVLAAPFPVPGAFSIGDVLVAAGLFSLLQWALVGPAERRSEAGTG
jgi:hypothetical protein